MKTSLLHKFRTIGNIEGTSYLILLFIAMPLKYIFEYPLAVKVVGMAHGVLFIAYVVLLLMAMKAYKWDFKYGTLLFIASLVPFGTFYTNKKLKKLQEAEEAKVTA